ncbi:MAG: HAMP domain-containing protein [bacterium]|nr:HAMP domain-containing protein [bacterium]
MFIFRSLKFKIALLAVLLVILVTAGIGFISIGAMTRAIETEIEKRGETLARNMAVVVADPLSREDDLYIASFVTDAVDIERNPDVLYVVVVDANDKIRGYKSQDTSDETSFDKYFDTDYESPKGVKPLGSEKYLAQTFDYPNVGPAYDIGVAVLLAGKKPVGEVHVGISQASLITAKRGIRIAITTISAIGILVGIVGSLVLGGFVTRPVDRLIKGVQKMGEGDSGVRVKVRSKDEIGSLTRAFNEMAESIGEKELIKDAFSRYVSRQVADIILNDPDKYISTLRGERKEVTILFADIRGFTTMSERYAPEEVVALLNDYLSRMTDVIFSYNGTLDKFLGDGLMAVFGAPIPMENCTFAAVKAAIDMRIRLDDFNKTRVISGSEAIRVGIGINFGDAIVGNVGSRERMDYTVIGDAVNIAQRIQSYSQEGQIILTEDAFNQVKDDVFGKALGEYQLKGKAVGVAIYEVTGIKE